MSKESQKLSLLTYVLHLSVGAQHAACYVRTSLLQASFVRLILHAIFWSLFRFIGLFCGSVLISSGQFWRICRTATSRLNAMRAMYVSVMCMSPLMCICVFGFVYLKFNGMSPLMYICLFSHLICICLFSHLTDLSYLSIGAQCSARHAHY